MTNEEVIPLLDTLADRAFNGADNVGLRKLIRVMQEELRPKPKFKVGDIVINAVDNGFQQVFIVHRCDGVKVIVSCYIENAQLDSYRWQSEDKYTLYSPELMK